MRLCYFVLIKRNVQNEITLIYVKDLNLRFKIDCLNEIQALGLNKSIEKRIKAYLQKQTVKGYYIDDPRGIEQYATTKLDIHDELRTIHVDFELKRGFFARSLPLLAKISFVVSELFSMVVSVAALQVTQTGKALSIAGSLTYGVSGLVMYFYSQGSYTMSKIGLKLDKLLQKKDTLENDGEKTPQNWVTSTKIIASRLVLGTCLVVPIVASNAAGYGSLTALGKQAKEINSIVPEDLFNIAKWVLVILGSITSLSFVGSFFYQLSEALERQWTGEQPDIEILQSASLEDEDLETFPLLGLSCR